MGATPAIAPAREIRHEPAAERRETSGVTSRLILSYVERERGREGVDRLLELAGVHGEEEQLLDENHWFSFEKKIALLEAAAEVLAERQVARVIGAASLEFNLAQSVKLSLRALGSPALVYKNIARANTKFTSTHRMDCVEARSNHARITYTDVSGHGYHPHDCGLNLGLLSSVPVLFALPPARISHPVCAKNGGDTCVYDIRWQDGASRGRRVVASVLAAIGGVGAALAFVPAHAPEASGLGAAILALTAIREWRFRERRYKLLEQKAAHNAEGAERLENSLRDLVSDLRLEEVLGKITRKAQVAVGGKEFALLVDGEADGTVSCRSSSGLPAHTTETLERWAVDHAGDLDGATVIDDVSRHDELASLAADPEVPLRSLCAAPLVFHGRRVGVLIALANGVTGFLPNDITLLESYAMQAAIALTNAQMFETQQALASRDPLTELLNHREFHESVARELERCRRHGGGVAVILFDLDGFKSVNDRRGHAAGDRVLRDVAAALAGSARTSDQAFRIGGDEFALLLPDTTGRDAISAAERAAEAIAAVDGRIGASYGIGEWPHAGPTKDTLLAAADMNLYAMKKAASDTGTRPGTVDPANAAARAARAASAEAARQRQRLAAARRLSVQLAPLLDTREIARATVQELNDSFGWFLVVMHRLHDDGVLRAEAMTGEMVDLLGGEAFDWEQPVSAGINGRAVTTGEPVIVPDTRQDPDFLKPDGDHLWAGSELAVPIRVAGKVWGVLDLEDREADAFGPDDLVFADLLAGHIGAALDRSRLYNELEVTFTTTLAMLSDALERKDAYTAAHADDVAVLSVAVARRLGLSEDEVKTVNYGGLLHDIGKIGIRSEILLKPAKLTEAEFEEIKQHTNIGADMLSRIPFFTDVVPLVRWAHERWDGRGYPDGLAGAGIPLGARIVCACDAYNAMITERPYKVAMPVEEAKEELRRNAGTQFDPAVVDALLAELEQA